MKINETTLLKIEQYLNQEMNTLEKEDFEAEINNSNELKEFIELYYQIDDFEDAENWTLYEGNSERLKNASQLFLAKDVQEFSKKTTAFRDNYHTSKNKKKTPWLRLAIGSGLAACIVLLLFSTLFQSNNLIDLYHDNKSWNELPSLTIKGDTEKLDIANIELFFLEKKYKETIILCNRVIQNTETIQPNILLYLGVSQLELELYQDALNSFSILENSTAIDFHKAYWYKSLVYLKQKNKEKASIELQKIVNNNAYFNHEKAINILRKIN